MCPEHAVLVPLRRELKLLNEGIRWFFLVHSFIKWSRCIFHKVCVVCALRQWTATRMMMPLSLSLIKTGGYGTVKFPITHSID